VAVKGSDTYERPFGPNAPWNIPVDRLATDPNSSALVSMLWNNGTASRPGNFNLNFSAYTYPVYDAREATGLYTVDTTWSTNIDGKQIPWNSAWKPAPGTDGQVIVIDPTTGREWDLWQVSFDGATVRATNGSLVQGDIASYEGGNVPSRGIGIQYLAMLVRPEEVAQGYIDHALSLPSRYTDKDSAVAPATKVEGSSASVPDGIPIGTRFALRVSDAEIDQWIDSLPDSLSAETVRSARIVAEALREYGWFITDTAGAAEFQFESNTTAASDWASLGLSPQTAGYSTYPQDLLDGLLRPERIYAVAPSNQYSSDDYAVKSYVSATLSSTQSHLALMGQANVDGTGNNASNDIRGNSGNNVLSGLDGHDSLFGGLGNDTLAGGAGNDTLQGGMGSDRFVMSKGGGQDVIADFVAGAGVNDVAVLDGYGFTTFTQVKAAMTQSGSNVVLNLGSGESLTFRNHAVADFVSDDFGFAASVPTPTPTPAPTPTPTPTPVPGITLTGTAGADTLVGTAGNDRLDGAAGNDILDGKAGNDWLRGAAGADIFVFGRDYDQDSLGWFDAAYDKVDVRGFGFTSFDTLLKGVTISSGTDAAGSYVDLNFGNGDTLHLPGVSSVSASNFIFSTAPSVPSVPSQPALFTLPTSGASTATISGTAGNDTLTGTSANETIGGKAGSDTMTGGGGDDIYYVDMASDKAVEFSGQGVDTVQCWAGSYTLAANVENLSLEGTWAHSATANGLNNLITLSAGGDTVNAGAGNDIIRSGAGADVMTGGTGTDIFVLAGGKADTITDFRSGEDRLDLRSLMSGAGYNGLNPFADGVLSVVQNGAGTLVSFDADAKGAAAPQLLVTLSGVTSSILGIQQDIAWS
jgi:Ca2+-binding RTX toxin-like protein